MTPLTENVRLARAVMPESLGINDADLRVGQKTYSWGTANNRVFRDLSPEVVDSFVGKTYDFNWFLSTSGATDSTSAILEETKAGLIRPPQNFADGYPVWMELNVPAGIRHVKVPSSSEREIILDKSRVIVTGSRLEKGKLILEMLVTENLE
jgi:hypothetical protein